jgi:hypothetical protein
MKSALMLFFYRKKKLNPLFFADIWCIAANKLWLALLVVQTTLFR